MVYTVATSPQAATDWRLVGPGRLSSWPGHRVSHAHSFTACTPHCVSLHTSGGPRASAHQDVVCCFTSAALSQRCGLLCWRVSTPITPAALASICSSLNRGPSTRQHHVAASNSVRNHVHHGALAKMLSTVGGTPLALVVQEMPFTRPPATGLLLAEREDLSQPSAQFHPWFDCVGSHCLNSHRRRRAPCIALLAASRALD